MVGVSGCERGRGKVCGHAGGSTAADHYRAPLVERMGKLRANVESAKLSEMLRGAAMQSENPTAKEETQSKPYQVRLPGFVVDEAVGLGDVVQRVTYAMGIEPCGGCERRTAAMNRWMVFTR
jgi:hypothetical protein